MTGSPQNASVKPPNRLGALVFVLLTFVCWFAFASLARIVIKCAPPFKCTIDALTPPASLTWPDTVVLVLTLLIALWASRRAVFPPEV